MNNNYQQADAAQAALAAGTLTKSMPLALYALEYQVRFEMFGQFTAPDEQGTKDAREEAQRRFDALPE